MELSRLENLYLCLQLNNWLDSLSEEPANTLCLLKLKSIDLVMPKLDRSAYRFILREASKCNSLEEVRIRCTYGSNHRDFWKAFKSELDRMGRESNSSPFQSVKSLDVSVDHNMGGNGDDGTITADLLSCFPCAETLSLSYLTSEVGLWPALELFHESYVTSTPAQRNDLQKVTPCLPELRRIELIFSGEIEYNDVRLLEQRCRRLFLAVNENRLRIGCSELEEIVLDFRSYPELNSVCRLSAGAETREIAVRV